MITISTFQYCTCNFAKSLCTKMHPLNKRNHRHFWVTIVVEDDPKSTRTHPQRTLKLSREKSSFSNLRKAPAYENGTRHTYRSFSLTHCFHFTFIVGKNKSWSSATFFAAKKKIGNVTNGTDYTMAFT